MIGLKDFFRNIQNRHTKELFLRSVIQETIKKQFNIDIPIGNIEVKDSTITLRGASSGLKAAIYTKKASMVAMINSGQDVRTITDIR